MIHTYLIKEAINFSIKTHELDQKQKRKSKDVPYITHPLTVGLLLARAGAGEEVIVAGILHDTIEDSIPAQKVTKAILTQRFNVNVAAMVDDVTELSKELPWKTRKKEALERIATFSHNSLLVKSVDVISNASDLIDDHQTRGDKAFSAFGAPKVTLLTHYLRIINAITSRWPDNPLKDDLQLVARRLFVIGIWDFETNTQIIEYHDYDKTTPLECSLCQWKSTPHESGLVEYYDDLLDVSCPNCSNMLLVVGYPLVKQ